jgi:Transcriptional Coactivator p15 (PC4)
VTHFKEKIFHEWPLKNGETMRVSIDNYEGYDLVHIRRWQRAPNGQLYPTEKGAAIGIGQLPRVLKALRKVRAHARKMGLLPPPR